MKTATKKTPATKGKNEPAKKESKTSAKTNSNGTVKAKSTAAEGLRELFVDSLKDIYWAEKALTKALPKMAKNATSENLVTAINDHLAVTQEQVARLEKVFSLVGEKPVAKKCDAMEGLIKEGESIMEETEVGAVRDAGIIAASQKIEHYEIATYGTLVVFAQNMGHNDVAELLQFTLDNEKATDVALTEIAVSAINEQAAAE